MASMDDRIKRVCGHIERNLDEPLDLERLSGIAAYSKFHFHRVFHARKGMTVARFLLLARLKRASFELAFEPDRKVIDIAFRAGYENPESFARAFRRTFRQSPTEFRKSPDWPFWHSVLIGSANKGSRMMEVTVKNVEDTRIAYLRHQGAPERVLQTAGRFVEWRRESGLSPKATSRTYGIPHDDPAAVAPVDFRFDICGTVSRPVPENDYGVEEGIIPGGRCAVLRHRGSHDNLADSVYYLYRDWLPESGEELRDFPVYFHYLNLIHDVDECDLLTDIHLPLR